MAKMGNLQGHALKLLVFQLCCCSGVSLILESIYQFGDSISDTGNCIRENASSCLCNNFPYGESFFHYVTGCCSDGLIMVDYYAMALGLPFLNPYLDGDADFSNGADFSVSGATALSLQFLESKNITTSGTNSSLGVQLGWFRNHLKSICSSQSVRRQTKKKPFSNGSNDYIYAFNDHKSFDVVYELVPDVINAITNAVKEMILLGAVHVVVPSVFPFGCLPSLLVLVKSVDSKSYDELGCARSFDQVAVFHNQKLYNATRELQVMHPHATIIYADYYSAIRLVIENAAALGFDEDSKFVACCGSGDNPFNFDLEEMCGRPGVAFCPNPGQRVSWDGLHFTQRFYKYVSEWMVEHTIMPRLADAASAVL